MPDREEWSPDEDKGPEKMLKRVMELMEIANKHFDRVPVELTPYEPPFQPGAMMDALAAWEARLEKEYPDGGAWTVVCVQFNRARRAIAEAIASEPREK